MAWNINRLADLIPRLQQMQAMRQTGGQHASGSQIQPFQLPSLMQSVPLPSGPAANAFLDRFGPYRLQSFDAMRPVTPVTGGGMGLFEPRGLEASGLLDPPPQAAIRKLFPGGGGNGRVGGDGPRNGGRGSTPGAGRNRGYG